MEISILIPVYNVEKYVIRCLESIANQSYTDSVECVIVDDCSTDNSIQLVNEFIANYKGNIQFKVVKHDRNRGSAAARNTGMNSISGTYVLQIDSDDYCEPTMLHDYINAAKECDAEIVISDFWYTYDDHEEYNKQYLPDTKIEIIEHLFNHKLFTVNWNKLIKRSLYTENNITYLDGANYGEDLRVCFPLLLAAKKIVHIEKAYVHYVQYNVNAYNHQLSRKSLEDYILNLDSVEQTILEAGLYDKTKQFIFEKQLWLKHILLLHSKGSLQKQWSKVFNSAKTHIFKSSMNTLWKIAMYFACKGVLLPFNILRIIYFMKHPSLKYTYND